MPQTIHNRTFANGLVLVAEPMSWVESAAFALLVPSGCQREPGGRAGLAGFTGEMVQRGCGERDSRQFIDDLENLGVERSASVSNAHASFGGAMVADKLPEVLGIYADVVQQPHLPEDEVEDTRLGCLQEVRAIEDEPAHKVMQELRRQLYPDPYGRSSQGTQETVEAISLDDVAQYFASTYSPATAILSVAGNFEWSKLAADVERLFGAWKARELPALKEAATREKRLHLPQESSQTHVAVGFPSVPYSHPDFFQARAAVGVLSDGMSSRLFTEVREKRGLSYSVYASCHSLRDRGTVMCYAAAVPEKAQEALDVLLAELRRLAQGVEPDELVRLKARMKSSLIMQQESSASRASAIAGDWYFLGRVRTMEELSRILDGITCDTINAYLAAHPPADFTVVTIGREPLKV